MKILKITFCIIWAAVFFACDENAVKWPKSSFDSPFPKRNKKLTNIIGESLIVSRNGEVIEYDIISAGGMNVIREKNTEDTLFYGKVSWYRGLYFFSQQIDDTSYWIFPVRISDNLITGLRDSWQLMLFVDSAIESDKFPELVKIMDKDNGHYLLHPRKKELNKLFESALNEVVPDTIIRAIPEAVALENEVQPDPTSPEDLEIVSGVFPNPIKDMVTVTLYEQRQVAYRIHDASGTEVMKGYFDNSANQLNLGFLSTGIYYLMIGEGPGEEIIKLIRI